MDIGKRIIGAATAAVMIFSGFAVATTSASAASSPLVSPEWSEDAIRNYAINLADEHAGSSTMTRAKNLVATVAQQESSGATVLASYPQFGSFFVQAASKSFAKDYAAAAARNGIALHSVGDTRQSSVRSDENVLQSGVSTYGEDAFEGTKKLEIIRKIKTYEEGLWGIKIIGGDKAKKVIKDDVRLSPVTVGVMDSGIDENQEDLIGQIDVESSTSCITNGIPDSDPDKRNQVKYDIMGDNRNNFYHGTHVAGTIAGKTYNSTWWGFTYENSVNPQAKLANIRDTYHNYIYPEYAVCGLYWAVVHHIPIVNASTSVDPWIYWVPNAPTQAAGYEVVRRVVEYAQSNDILLIASAMNNGDDLDNISVDSYSPNDTGFPIPNRPVKGGKSLFSSLPGVIAVSNVQRNVDGTLSRNEGSNYGANTIAIAAPGTDIASAYPVEIGINSDGGWGWSTGTSMAAPHVAGVASLIKGIHPEYTAAQIKAQLFKQANYKQLSAPTDGKEYRGAGMVDAYAAVTKNQPKATISSVQYSTDGGSTWSNLHGATIGGKVKIRAVMGGAVTSGAFSGAVTASKNGAGTLTLTKDVDYSNISKTANKTLTITAYGRNSSKDADDDTTMKIPYTVKVDSSAMSSGPEIYRLYHSGANVHHYTASAGEMRTLVQRGWKYEGVLGRAAAAGTGSPVYRLYHNGIKQHHFTMSAYERDANVRQGWRYEGVAWHSGGRSGRPIYRLYNDRNKEHFYTSSLHEYNVRGTQDWRKEGIVWYSTE
ncbi:S8 family serine peptidase [Bifidobacterium sp. SMB2]|uniref:S8 family serine peptidase n=1 Tax=Bifidobacterium saimiriisciurei TaxID=2661627 RepID=A0ABX0C8H2_9BIFI|nr:MULTISPECIES: S8 family serine peptidase [Bifidobacterium]NEG95373.1 S8 family serine peptidase [Bifidobacterium sp. SMB2]NEH11443.1 S8 family serine peptidase [Bifidobacterium saimiriisciurei]